MPALTFNVEIDWVEPEPVEPAADCREHGRTTRAFVSGYQRARVHRSRLVRGERRCLIADFNGAIPAGRTITSVTWRTNQPAGAILSDAGIVAGGRKVRVDLLAGSGCAQVKCDVTLDNGEVYNQRFEVSVQSGPWFQGEVNPTQGPRELTAVAT